MVSLLNLILKTLPWILVVVLLSWMLMQEKMNFGVIEGQKETYQSTILHRVEQIGKLEVVKYNFQEVTEVQKLADYVDLKIFKYKLMPDSRAILISQGSAAGCVDLTKIKKSDIKEVRDTLYVTLPVPELCYFKIDLENSRIYDLEISGMSRKDQKKFMESLYKLAEKEIRESALNMGIMEQTEANAISILTPLLENISQKKVVLTFVLEEGLQLK